MVGDMASRRAALALVLLLVCPACGEVQEAEPMTKTVPAAAVIVGSGLFVAFMIIRSVMARWRGGQTGSAAPTTYPRATVALTLAPAGLATTGLVLALSSVVAFGYRDAHVNLLTWKETLAFAVVATGGALLVLAASAAVGRGLISTHGRERRASRVVLGLVIVAGSVVVPGLGLVWLPAAIACSSTGGPRQPPVPPAGRHGHGGCST